MSDHIASEFSSNCNGLNPGFVRSGAGRPGMNSQYGISQTASASSPTHTPWIEHFHFNSEKSFRRKMRTMATRIVLSGYVTYIALGWNLLALEIPTQSRNGPKYGRKILMSSK